MKRTGFTLIEILVVMAILTIVSSFSFKTLPRFAGQLYLNGAAQTIAAELRALQSKALLQHETLNYDLSQLKLPAGISLANMPQISFAASGATPPGGSGTLILQSGLGSQKKIIVSSSGRVRFE
ncbi:MAG: prepilin-type N-terminal cleavage/methylation domain-containing protein [Candidatus Margulisbacteria bacterium]|nr:prepilin-type N-terminal cleavage/methylation domain-containing protein [Candidatus Margulisiibacteriota bacterium]